MIAWLLANYLIVVGGYTAGGALYAVLKWTLTMVKIRRKVLALTDPGLNDKREIVKSILGEYQYPPKASDNKGNLLFWAIAWPINLIWTLFADVIKEAWAFLYNTFGSILQKITHSILPA